MHQFLFAWFITYSSAEIEVQDLNKRKKAQEEEENLSIG